MFYTAEELAVLTGRKQWAKQILCLEKNELVYFVDADGRPIVPKPARKVSEAARVAPSPRFDAVAARH